MDMRCVHTRPCQIGLQEPPRFIVTDTCQQRRALTEPRQVGRHISRSPTRAAGDYSCGGNDVEDEIANAQNGHSLRASSMGRTHVQLTWRVEMQRRRHSSHPILELRQD